MSLLAGRLLNCLQVAGTPGRPMRQLLLFLMTHLHYSTLQCIMSHHYSGISHLQQITDQLNTSSEFLSPADTPETDHRAASLFPQYYLGWKWKLSMCRPGWINEHHLCTIGL